MCRVEASWRESGFHERRFESLNANLVDSLSVDACGPKALLASRKCYLVTFSDFSSW